MAVAALIISSMTFIWRIYEFYIDKRGRLKITHDFHPNFLIGELQLTAMYEFNIVNTSSKKRIIKSICHQYSIEKDGYYCPGLQHLKFPKSLEPGESVQYEVYYSDFNNLIEKSSVTKIRIIVTDSFGKEYQSKWIKVEQWDIPEIFKNKGFKKANQVNKS